MKRNVSKVFFTFLFLFAMLCISTFCQANSIDSIDMRIHIDSSGTANITEIWKAHLSSGTEGYKPYGNLKNCEIKDFTVHDDTGTEYSYDSSWDVDDSFNEKKYKCGIHRADNKIELCWGISNYGDRTYTLNYKITNFINQYTDSQGINFFLMPIEMDNTVDSIQVQISSPYQFTTDNTQIYSFGFEGTTEIKDGVIILKTSETFKSSNYMIAVAKFNQNYFPTGNNIDLTFEQDLQETQDYANKLQKNQVLLVIFVIGLLLFIFLLFAAILITIYLFTAPEMVFDGGNKIPSVKKSDYWRDIPCNKDIFKAYWIGEKYNIIKDKSGLIGAILLIWIQKGYIKLSNTSSGHFSIKDNKYAIDFSNFSHCENAQEQKLLDYFRSASGSNLLLEPQEFKKYCEKNYSQIEKWFVNVVSDYTKQFEREGLITTTTLTKKFLFFHKNHSTKKANIELQKEAIKLQGLKRFLLDYSLINKRGAIEVQLWEEYLIFAQLLGIADKISEQFSLLYPDMNQISNLNTEFTTIAISNISYTGYHAAHSSYMSSQSSGSYGGSGSIGGSSGGGFR